MYVNIDYYMPSKFYLKLYCVANLILCELQFLFYIKSMHKSKLKDVNEEFARKTKGFDLNCVYGFHDSLK